MGGKRALQFLKLYALPHELVKFSDQELLFHLRKAVKRSVGLSKIQELKQAASKSIGLKQGASMAKLELETLIDKYELIQIKFEELDSKIDTLIDQIPGVQQMLAIKGVGRIQLPAFLLKLVI